MNADNGLHKLTAVGAVLVGAFLLLGAAGHFRAVLPLIDADPDHADAFRLLLPGIILAASGLLSAALCKVLWEGRKRALDVAAGINAAALAYLLYLLWKGVPDHPVALFTGIVACNLVVLAATRFGLVWPVGQSRAED